MSSEDVTILLTMTSTYTLSTSSSTPPAGLTTLTSVYTRQIVSSVSRQSMSATAAASASASFSTSSLASVSSFSAPSPQVLPSPPKKTSNSATLGLSIGIPIAIVSLFVLVSLGYFMFKRVRLAQPTTNPPGARDFTSTTSTASSGTAVSEPRAHKPPPLEISQHPARNIKRQSLMYHFKNRISRHFKDDDLEMAAVAGPGSFSPMFLKRFKLGARDAATATESPTAAATTNTPAPRKTRSLKLVSVVDESHSDRKRCLVKRPYVQRLADELSLEVGDMVVLLAEYSDGWCKVQLDGRSGMVPQVCLTSL